MGWRSCIWDGQSRGAAGSRVLYDEEMLREQKATAPLARFWRAVIEVAFIIFLFYANLLMGEFTSTNGRGKSFAFALNDVFTGKDFAIAVVAALFGYAGFEYLRKRF